MLAGAAVARLDGAARLILRDGELARDAVQDALVRAWRDLPGLRDPDKFDAWLRRLTVNACIDAARRRRRRSIEVELTPILMPSIADESAGFAEREQLDDALRRLDPEWRAIVVQHFFLGMPLAEISVAMGIPIGTVKSRLHRSLQAMKVDAHGRRPRRDRSASPEGSSHELVRTLRAQAAGAPRRARGAADARLLRRHPRPGRPHAAATGLDLPRKVAPHVRRLRSAGDRAARPVARRRRRRPPAHRPRRAASRCIAGSRQRRVPAPFGPAENGAHRLRRPARRDPVGHSPTPRRSRSSSRAGQRAPGVLARRHKLAYLHKRRARRLRRRRRRARRHATRHDHATRPCSHRSYLGWTPDGGLPSWSAPRPGKLAAFDAAKQGAPTVITDKVRFSGNVSGLNGGRPGRRPVPRPLGDEIAFLGSGPEGDGLYAVAARRIRASGRSSRRRPAVCRSSTC